MERARSREKERERKRKEREQRERRRAREMWAEEERKRMAKEAQREMNEKRRRERAQRERERSSRTHGHGTGAGGGAGYRRSSRQSSQAAAGNAQKDKTHYDVLGVSSKSDATLIKKAYRKLALRFHPDKNKAAGAEDMFKRINEAYTCLKSPAKRRDYDRKQSASSFSYGGYRRY